MRSYLIAVLVALALIGGPAAAATPDTGCRAGQGFQEWLAEFRAEAAARGISQRALATLDGLAVDERVLNLDRRQATLSQSFLQFADRVISADRLRRGGAVLARHAGTFARIERDFGVPGPVIAAFWGLETDFGAFTGDFSAIRSLATLAYDCRRTEHFRAELLAALMIVERGDLAPGQMKGAWAGELGQVQFAPTNYLRHAVDYDGDGRRDLVASVPDALASAANYLRHLGWRVGEPWLEEVQATGDVPWSEAARENLRPRSFWARAGIRRADGSVLPADSLPAALILPMGRHGPAFLGTRNFLLFWEWNQSSNYSLAAAWFAKRLAGAPAMRRGGAPPILASAEMRELQQRLNRAGYDAGIADGRLGEITRAAVKRAQAAFGLPADGYPTAELLARLRQGR